MQPRPIEQTRLINARRLAKEAGGTSAMAVKLGKSQAQWQNTIGKTPIKNIGAEIAREIERVYKLDEGWMDMPWDMAPQDAVALAVDDMEAPASAALNDKRRATDVRALRLICGAIVNALAVSQPDAALAVEFALNNPEIPQSLRDRGPIEALLAGLAQARAAVSGARGRKPRKTSASLERS